MRCPTCNEGDLQSGREDYPYVESGLDDVVLVDLEVRRCNNPDCAELMPVIPQLEGLHRELAFLLARQSEKLRGKEIRFLRKYLGWSGADAARNLHVTPETVSRWENEQTSMGPANELLLRILTLTLKPVESYSMDKVLKKVTLVDKRRPTIRLRGGGGKPWRTAALAA